MTDFIHSCSNFQQVQGHFRAFLGPFHPGWPLAGHHYELLHFQSLSHKHLSLRCVATGLPGNRFIHGWPYPTSIIMPMYRWIYPPPKKNNYGTSAFFIGKSTNFLWPFSTLQNRHFCWAQEVRPNAGGGIFRDHAARRMMWEQQKRKWLERTVKWMKWMKNGWKWMEMA